MAMGGRLHRVELPLNEWHEPSLDEIEAAATRMAAAEKDDFLGPFVHTVALIDAGHKVPDPKLAFLLDYWKGLLPPDGGLPLRSRIDVLDMIPAVGNILLLDVERDGFDARYRVYGSAVADRGGRDWTGKTVSEMNAAMQTPVALMYRAAYRCAYVTGRPLYTEHESPMHLAVQHWHRLVLPLADDAGGCSSFLVGNIPVKGQSA